MIVAHNLHTEAAQTYTAKARSTAQIGVFGSSRMRSQARGEITRKYCAFHATGRVFCVVAYAHSDRSQELQIACGKTICG